MVTPAVLREIRRATRPHGAARRDDLQLTDRQLQWAVASGVLLQPNRLAFLDPLTPRTALRDLAAAVAAGGPLGGAWARSSAALWALVDEHPSVPEVVVPWRRRARIEGAMVHRSVGLCAEHLIIRNGIRTTKPLITIVDLGVVLPPMDVAESIVRGRQLRLFEVDGVRRTIEKLARPGRTGIGAARDAVELAMIGERPADSILELRFHHGPGQMLPPYTYQHEIVIGRRRYRIDFAYPSVKVAIEVDGLDKRRTLASLSHDARRGNQIGLDGWFVLHFTWDRIMEEPLVVVAEIITALGQRGYTF
jgi:very-short-patch-repair endonuclease